MKNACIVLHNYRNVPDPAMTNGIVGAFLSGGYCFDRLEFLPRNDIGAFKQAVAEAKSFFDNLVVVAEPELYSTLRDQMELCYNTSFLTQAILDAGQKVAVLLPCGGAGERIAREDAVPFLERKYRERCDRMVVRAVAVPSDMLDAALRELVGDFFQCGVCASGGMGAAVDQEDLLHSRSIFGRDYKIFFVTRCQQGSGTRMCQTCRDDGFRGAPARRPGRWFLTAPAAS